MTGKVFINYRKSLSREHAELLHAHLRDHLPADRLFIDRRDLHGVSDWFLELQRQVAESAVMVSVISPGWADVTDPDTGARRLEATTDFVRIEIAEAIRRNIPLVPVLINGASMPPLRLLPEDLWWLTRAQALPLRTDTIEADVAAIAKVIADKMPKPPAPPPEPIVVRRGPPAWVTGVSAAAMLAAGVGAGVWFSPSETERVTRAETAAGRAEVARSRAEGEREDALRRIGEKDGQLSTATNARDEARAAAAAAERARSTAQADLKAAQEALSKGSSDVAARIAAAVQPVTRERDEARSKLAVAEAALAKAEAAAKTAETRVAAAEKARGEADTAAKAARDKLAAADTARTAAEAERDRAKAAEAAAKVALEKARGETPPSPPPPVPPLTRDAISALVPGSGKSARDCDDGCPEMVVVPKGTFRMGSEDGEADEKPVREVTIRQPFAVGKYEVTVGQYMACVDAKVCRPPEWLEVGSTYHIKTGTDDHYKKMGTALTNPTNPIVGVAWTDAQAYAAWLKTKTGHTYRLLSEAEWEYAARGVTSTSAPHPKFHFGDDDKQLGDYAWFSSNSGGKTQAVGGKKPNAFGLHDMHGNTWEWVQDCWIDSYRNAPADGSARTTACTEDKARVVRGGSWVNRPVNLRAADRYRIAVVNRINDLGFRVGRVVFPLRPL